MNNPSLESYYVVIFKCYAFDNISCNISAYVSSFSSISRKIINVASFNPIQTHFMFLVYLLVTNVSSVCRSLKKLENEGSTMFGVSLIQKLEKKKISRKFDKYSENMLTLAGS